MPTLFIAGGLDRMSVPEVSRRMADCAPNADFMFIKGAAHISNIDTAEVFTARMLDFLSHIGVYKLNGCLSNSQDQLSMSSM